ncbi:MAG: ATP-binding protein [Thermodesulfobacteriota bacterium]|nr:MAG: ATP-binding protein [Thermodesulfobacteriota bacterium]
MRKAYLGLSPKSLPPEQTELVLKLSLLHETSQAMMTTIKLDDLLHIIITAVTMEGGFGFNRAMLFLVNHSAHTLEGMIGMGPESAEDARRIWNEFAQKKVGLLEWVLSPERILSKVRSRVDEICKSIIVPLHPIDGGILARTVLEKTYFNVSDEKEDTFIWENIYSKVGGGPFATVPIIAKGQATGVIKVDNIYNNKPISEEDIKMLTIFASQAGMAIENSRLYQTMELAHQELREAQEQMLHAEKLVAIGEMSASIAHEIRTPLVSIGGFARRLCRSHQFDKEKEFLEIIVKEVDRLEAILNQVLVFSKEPFLNLLPYNLNQIVEDSLHVFSDELRQDNINVIKELNPNLPLVFCDYPQIKQVFINLIANARQAMTAGGYLKFKSCFSEDDKMVIVEVEDTGGGIMPKIIGNIFNPFFTTKEKGLGLGLSITHKIMLHHHGTILVKNDYGKGTTFILHFPFRE